MNLPTHASLKNRWGNPLHFVVALLFVCAIATVVSINTIGVLNNSNYHESQRTSYHYDDLRVTEKDYIANYLRALPSPLLFYAITKAALAAKLDLVLFHKLLIVFCNFILLINTALIAKRFNGTLAGIAAVAIVSVQPIFHYQINSASSHSFAFPLIMMGFALLVYEKHVWLGLLVIVSGLLYPPIAAPIWLMLAWKLVINKQFFPLSRHSVLVLFGLVVIGLVAAALLLQQLLPVDGFGDRTGPFDQIQLFPENGPDGRFSSTVSRPLYYVFGISITQFRSAIPGGGVLLLCYLYVLFAFYGLWQLLLKSDFRSKILSFLVPLSIFFVVVYIFKPSLSYRFLLYPLHTILPILFVSGVFYFAMNHTPGNRKQAGLIIGAIFLYLLTFNSVDSYRQGFTFKLDNSSHELNKVIQQLPRSVLIAAWPNAENTDLIPYITGKPLFVSRRGHAIAGHTNVLMEMRQRMNALIDAYFGDDHDALVRLHCRWGVDYLIVDRMHFLDKSLIKEYFEPFQSLIKTKLLTIPTQQMILFSPPDAWVTDAVGNYLLINMSMVVDSTGCASS